MVAEWISNFDMECFTFFGNIQSSFLTSLAKLFSLDNQVLLVIGILVLAGLCIIRKTRRIGFALVFVIAVGYLLTDGMIKPLVCRERPYIALQDNAMFMEWYNNVGMPETSHYSFPSGHTTAFASATTVLLFFHAKSGKKLVRAIAWVFPVLAVLAGCSRIYLMTHYATDVIGGFLIGASAGVGGCVLFNLSAAPGAA